MKKIILSNILLIVFIYSYSQNEWSTFSIPNSEFSIQMPFEPSSGVQSATALNSTINMDYLYCETDTISFFAFYSIYPPNLIDNSKQDLFYAKAIDTLLCKVNGKLILKNADSIIGYKGIFAKIKIKDKKQILFAKEFLIGDRLIQLLVFANTKYQGSKSIVKFYDSFTITENITKDEISSLLDYLGFSYEKDEDNQFYLTINYSADERSQLVYITPMILNYDSKLYYDVWSPIFSYNSFLPDSISQFMLEQNNMNETGSFQSLKSDNGYFLVYSAKFPENMDTTTLKKALFFVTEIADDMELKLSTEDKY